MSTNERGRLSCLGDGGPRNYKRRAKNILRPRCPASAKTRRRRLVAAVAAADARWRARYLAPLLRAIAGGPDHG